MAWSSATRWSGFRRSDGLMLRPLLTALLGVALCLAGGTFDAASLYVPGVGLIVLAVGALVWVQLAARGATVDRVPGPHTVVEEEPYPLRVEVKSGSAGPCRSPGAGRGGCGSTCASPGVGGACSSRSCS